MDLLNVFGELHQFLFLLGRIMLFLFFFFSYVLAILMGGLLFGYIYCLCTCKTRSQRFLEKDNKLRKLLKEVDKLQKEVDELRIVY